MKTLDTLIVCVGALLVISIALLLVGIFLL